MAYVIAFLAGAGCGALVAWLLVMAIVDRWKQREIAASTLSKEAEASIIRSKARQALLDQDVAALGQRQADFEKRVITYRELDSENGVLKRDLQNIDVLTHKLEIDGEIRQREMTAISARSEALARRYLNESIKAVVAAIGPSNFTACKQKLIDVVARCREIGFTVSKDEETALILELKTEFERAVRAEFGRQEQARIKAQIREEEKLKREIDRELKQLERERAAVQAALDAALAIAKGEHTAEVQQLQLRLAEAEEKSKRAMSMAQQTKAGHVYIISNIGTFGSDVFKIGMTRRLKPEERVYELGSASVPFPFDVHMMISTDNAPSLENSLHRALQKKRINKANPRKEFFRVTFEEIHRIVEAEHGKVEFLADPEALEYRQSLTMSDEDAAFVEQIYDEVEEGEENK